MHRSKCFAKLQILLWGCRKFRGGGGSWALECVAPPNKLQQGSGGLVEAHILEFGLSPKIHSLKYGGSITPWLPLASVAMSP